MTAAGNLLCDTYNVVRTQGPLLSTQAPRNQHAGTTAQIGVDIAWRYGLEERMNEDQPPVVLMLLFRRSPCAIAKP